MSERDIFLAAIEIPIAADRNAFLDQACAGNEILRAQVDALLRAYDDPQSFLAQPAVEQVAARPSSSPPPPSPVSPNSGSDATQDFSLHDPDGVLSGLLAPSTVPGSLGRLGHFEVQQVLGTGGFGTVLRAFDDRLHRMVAIKLMSAEMASTSPARKRFLREARAAAAIRHEHVVNIYSVEEEPLPYLVMEFIPGQTLEQKLNGSGPLELSEALRLGEQMAQGLAAAHAMGLVHRDIKPANILLESGVKERVKITDFGLARTADDATVTQSGVIAGTPMYMAPEQAWGRPLDQRADLFSLGSVLYQMVSGRPPFRAETTLAVLKRVTEDTPRPIQEIIPETPTWLCAIIARLQAKEPDDRFQTAKEVADLLARCQTELQLTGKVTSVQGSPVAPRQEAQTSSDSPKRSGSDITAEHPNVSPAARHVSRSETATSGNTVSISFRSPGRRWWRTFGAGMIVAVVLFAAFMLNRSKYNETANLAIREPSAPGQAESTDSTNPDRRAAEWVLRSGGRLSVKMSDNTIDVNVDGLDQLPQGKWTLLNISFDDAAKLPEDELVKNLQSITDLKGSLYIQRMALTDVGLAQLAAIPGLANLENLTLSGVKVSDDAIVHLKKLSRLVRLDLSDVSITGTGLIHLRELPNLRILGLYNTKITDDNVKHLRPLLLKELGFSDNRNTTNAALKTIAELAELEGLGIHSSSGSVYDDEGFGALKKLKNLRDLQIVFNTLSDAGVERFADCTKLVSLNVKHTKVTEAGVKKLAAALPMCKIEWDGGVIEPTVSPDRRAAEWVLSIGGKAGVNDQDRNSAGIAELPKEPFRLTSINFQQNERVTDEGLAHFQDCKNLTSLHLGGVKVTDAGVAHFKDCKDLAELTLGYTLVTDAGLAHFQDCKSLSALDLGGTKVTDAGMAYFKDCKNLAILHLYSTKVSDAGLAHFKAWKKLRLLSLDAAIAVSDAGLAHLADCPMLVALNVKNTKVTEAGVKKLSAALTECKIQWDGGVIEPRLTASDRRAAEYVLSIGGSIKIIENGQEREIKAVEDLPSGAFDLTHVGLAKNGKVTDAGLVSFQDCKNLTSLDLADTNVSDQGLEQLAGYSQLGLLKVMKSKVTKAGVKKLSAALPGCKIKWDGDVIEPRVTTVSRGEWRIVDDVIEHLTKGKRAMLLFGSPEFGDGDFICEALRDEGGNGLALVARATDLENYYYFEIGSFNNEWHSLYAKEAGADWRRIDQKKAESVPADRWVKLRLKLRGDTFEGYLDDTLVASGRDDRRLKGYIGLRTWNEAGKYRNLKFTSPEGKVL